MHVNLRLLLLSLALFRVVYGSAELVSPNPCQDAETTTMATFDGGPHADIQEIASPPEALMATEGALEHRDFIVNLEPLDIAVLFEDAETVRAESASLLIIRSLASKYAKCISFISRVLVSGGHRDNWFQLFLFLFVFRYLRLVVHIIAYNRFKPKPVLENPTYAAKDVTVIIPTVEPRGVYWEECISRVLATGPAQILVVTVGEDNIRDATASCNTLSSSIRVLSVPAPSKREQVRRAVQEVRTPITILCDDTVFWPSTLISHILAPFEDPLVGIVGTCKRVRRVFGAFGPADFWNLCGVFRLERTNFDLAATNAVDGGVSCVSGRTCAIRTRILKDDAFLHEYTNERTVFGQRKNAGDDKLVTRLVLRRGWKAWHQNCAEARIETTIGVKGGGARFRGQCLRWARSSAVDNAKMLVADGLWRRHPWTAYAVLATSAVNYAALYDPALVYALRRALDDPAVADHSFLGRRRLPLVLLCLWILATKFVRPAAHYRRHPRDLKYAPFVILFGYYHSWIKLYALLTFWDVSWGTRPGVDGAAAKSSKAV